MFPCQITSLFSICTRNVIDKKCLCLRHDTKIFVVGILHTLFLENFFIYKIPTQIVQGVLDFTLTLIKTILYCVYRLWLPLCLCKEADTKIFLVGIWHTLFLENIFYLQNPNLILFCFEASPILFCIKSLD